MHDDAFDAVCQLANGYDCVVHEDVVSAEMTQRLRAAVLDTLTEALCQANDEQRCTLHKLIDGLP